jgi:hypothetical protein
MRTSLILAALAIAAPAAFAQTTECDRNIRGYVQCNCGACVRDAYNDASLSREKFCPAQCAAMAKGTYRTPTDIVRADKNARRTERMQGFLEAWKEMEDSKRKNKDDDN